MELASLINADPEVQFAGQGLRDQFGAPVVYTENAFIKFTDDVSRTHAEQMLSGSELTLKERYGTFAFLAYVSAGIT